MQFDGTHSSTELQDSISEMNEPALSAVTVMLRGMRTAPQYKDRPFGELIAIAVERVKAGKTNYGASTKPLIDTGLMRQNAGYIVKS